MFESKIDQNVFEEIQLIVQQNISLTQEQALRFFKTLPGSYGVHDKFLGITTPNLRKIAFSYQHVSLFVVQLLFRSCFNEERLLGLFILIFQYQKANMLKREKLYNFYLENIEYVNNWNLVDASAYKIIGHYLFDKDRDFLDTLAKSNNLWHRRIAIVATLYFIRLNDSSTTLKFCKYFFDEKEDLVCKAAGWMLREVGKKDKVKLINFLINYKKQLSKVTLRYAMENLSDEQKHFINEFVVLEGRKSLIKP